jgi:hypothetical protein
MSKTSLNNLSPEYHDGSATIKNFSRKSNSSPSKMKRNNSDDLFDILDLGDKPIIPEDVLGQIEKPIVLNELEEDGQTSTQ